MKSWLVGFSLRFQTDEVLKLCCSEVRSLLKLAVCVPNMLNSTPKSYLPLYSPMISHDFPIFFQDFALVFHNFSTQISRRSPQTSQALKRAAEHAVNVTYVTQRVFLNGADVWLGRSTTGRCGGVDPRMRKTAWFLGPMGPMGNQKMMENWEPTTMGNWIYSRFMIAK